MSKRLLANDIYIAVYRDVDGELCFATWGQFGNRKIRWYKTRKEGEKQLAEALRPEETRTPKPPANTKIVKFSMAEWPKL